MVPEACWLLRYHFTKGGLLYAVSNDSTASLYWEARAADAAGQVKVEPRGWFQRLVGFDQDGGQAEAAGSVEDAWT